MTRTSTRTRTRTTWRRLASALTAVGMTAGLLALAQPAQAFDADSRWLGDTTGEVVVDRFTSGSGFGLVANDSAVMLAYQVDGQIVLTSSPGGYGSVFTEVKRIDLGGLKPIEKVRLDAGPDGSTIISFQVANGSGQRKLWVYRVSADGLVTTYELDTEAEEVGYDLDVAADGSIVAVQLADFTLGVFPAASFISPEGDITESAVVFAGAETAEPPQVVVDPTGQALVVFRLFDGSTSPNHLVAVWCERGGARCDGETFLSTEPIGVWDLAADEAGNAAAVMQKRDPNTVQAGDEIREFHPVTRSLMKIQQSGVSDVASVDTLQFEATNMQATVHSSNERLFTWNVVESVGRTGIRQYVESPTFPGAGVVRQFLAGYRGVPTYPQFSGMDDDGYPWIVSSMSENLGDSAVLLSRLYRRDDGAPDASFGVVGEGFFSVAYADVAVLDRSTMVAAWITFGLSGDEIRLRWFDTPPGPQPATNPAATVNADGSLTVTWTPGVQVGGVVALNHRAEVTAVGSADVIASCNSPFRNGFTCDILAPGLVEGVDYVVTIETETTTGDTVRSAPSAPFSLGADPDPNNPDPNNPDPNNPDPNNPDPNDPGVGPTITIVGSRGEVRGRPGILVDGTTTGLVGATLMPRFKFAGQVDYSDGIARRTVAADGTFEWQRRTGKKIYIIFKAVDDSVRSNRVIIRT